jgi:Domain of unknown function (DUF4105)
MPKLRQVCTEIVSAAVRRSRSVLVVFLLLSAAAEARADADLLVEEPINLLGQLSPTGHVALMMEQLCPDGPLKVRVCREGEGGAVIGRYSGIGTLDFLVIAPGAYLYAVDDASKIPTSETPAGLAELRQAYVDEHPSPELAFLRPQQWEQLLGAAYRRQILVVHLQTTPEQDALLMEWLNDLPNQRRFNFFVRNCADFVRQMLNVIYPGAIHRSVLFDVGLTTPKQVASALHQYSETHPEVGYRVEVIPQIAGSITRSTQICGVTACLAFSRPYFYPLALLQPVGAWSVAVTATVGICDRRYNIQKSIRNAPRMDPGAPAIDGHQLLPAQQIAAHEWEPG